MLFLRTIVMSLIVILPQGIQVYLELFLKRLVIYP